MNECDRDVERLLLDAIAERVGSERFGLWFGPGTHVRVNDSMHPAQSSHLPVFPGHSSLSDTKKTDCDLTQLTPARLKLLVPNSFLADWIRKNFRDLIDEAARSALGRTCSVSIAVANGNTARAETAGEREPERSMPTQPGGPQGVAIHSSFPADRATIAPVTPVALALAEIRTGATMPAVVRRPSETAQVAPVASIGPVGVVVRNRGDRSRVTPSSIAASPVKIPVKAVTGTMRPGATLADFVVAPSNKLARKAADFAIDHPGQINPIYVFGPTSTGKTHLLEAIRTAISQKSGRRPPLLLSAEQFTNTFINSVRQGGMPTFRNKFRDISTFLLDDLPFLVGKKQTQIELIQLIDTLKSQGVQIVITGNRPLGQLTGLPGEILARLEAGMVCEIKPAESDTLLAIFRTMCTARELAVPEDVCRFVAANLNVHARQLSGALNRLHAVRLTTGEPITLETAQTALEDLLRNHRRSVKIQDIEKAVCETFGLHPQSLQSKSRAKSVTQPRMLAMWLARKFTRAALTEIGKFFGDRSHSTVITAQKKVEQWIGEDAAITCGPADCRVAEAIRLVERHLVSP